MNLLRNLNTQGSIPQEADQLQNLLHVTWKGFEHDVGHAAQAVGGWAEHHPAEVVGAASAVFGALQNLNTQELQNLIDLNVSWGGIEKDAGVVATDVGNAANAVERFVKKHPGVDKALIKAVTTLAGANKLQNLIDLNVSWGGIEKDAGVVAKDVGNAANAVERFYKKHPGVDKALIKAVTTLAGANKLQNLNTQELQNLIDLHVSWGGFVKDVGDAGNAIGGFVKNHPGADKAIIKEITTLAGAQGLQNLNTQELQNIDAQELQNLFDTHVSWGGFAKDLGAAAGWAEHHPTVVAGVASAAFGALQNLQLDGRQQTVMLI